MSLKRIGLTLVLVSIIIAVYGPKIWRHYNASEPLSSTLIHGPAVILFRGDNDPGCQRIYKLVEEAAAGKHDQRIQFIQQEWSDKNSLIAQYQIRFLPSVVFIDQHDQVKLRIEGESPAVQQQLQQTLAQLEQMLIP